jgi:hypothetical protein
MRRSDKPPKTDEPQLSDLAIYDVPLIAVERTAASADVPVDKRLVTIPRRWLYVQGSAIGAIVLLAFLVGFLSGRGARVDEQSEVRQPADVTGQVDYRTQGERRPDSGAVALVLPAAAAPRKKIPVEGLRPSDPPPLADSRAVEAIADLGGAYLRADKEGRFACRLAPGRYMVLVISAHANRELASEPLPADLVSLGKVLDGAADLLGPAAYQLAFKRLPDEPLEFTLGASE